MVNVVLLLAIVAAGEAGPVEEAVEMIMHSAMNRVGDEGFPNTVVEALLEGYNGWGVPTARHFQLARQVLLRDSDPTGGIKFVLSREDVELLDCPPGVMIYREGPWEVHGYQEWCAGKGD